MVLWDAGCAPRPSAADLSSSGAPVRSALRDAVQSNTLVSLFQIAEFNTAGDYPLAVLVDDVMTLRLPIQGEVPTPPCGQAQA